jgi:hypothetical protein
MSITYYFDSSDTFVNMANANAWRIMNALGMEADYVGSIAVDDLKGRLLLCAAVGPKAGLDVADPASREVLAALSGAYSDDCDVCSPGPTIIDCSRPLDEYLAIRIPDLLGLCDAASAAGYSEIHWS